MPPLPLQPPEPRANGTDFGWLPPPDSYDAAPSDERDEAGLFAVLGNPIPLDPLSPLVARDLQVK